MGGEPTTTVKMIAEDGREVAIWHINQRLDLPDNPEQRFKVLSQHPSSPPGNPSFHVDFTSGHFEGSLEDVRFVPRGTVDDPMQAVSAVPAPTQQEKTMSKVTKEEADQIKMKLTDGFPANWQYNELYGEFYTSTGIVELEVVRAEGPMFLGTVYVADHSLAHAKDECPMELAQKLKPAFDRIVEAEDQVRNMEHGVSQ